MNLCVADGDGSANANDFLSRKHQLLIYHAWQTRGTNKIANRMSLHTLLASIMPNHDAQAVGAGGAGTAVSTTESAMAGLPLVVYGSVQLPEAKGTLLGRP